MATGVCKLELVNRRSAVNEPGLQRREIENID
jgi:hypothetical protein